MTGKIGQIKNSLQDARSGKLVFLSHCILNQNACVRGLASQPAVVCEMVDHDGKALPSGDSPPNWESSLISDAPSWFLDLSHLVQEILPDMLDKSQNLARKTAQTHRFEGAAKMEKVLTREKYRLVTLSKINYLWPGGASR